MGELKICLYVHERPKPHGKDYNCVKTNNITHIHVDKAVILPLSFSHTRNMCLELGRQQQSQEWKRRRGTGGILKTANRNHQDRSILRGKQSPRILIVDCFIKCFMALRYSSLNKSSVCTLSNSPIPCIL